jgi:hypothetical protein
MNNTIKFVAVCVAAPVMALGVAAPTAWANPEPPPPPEHHISIEGIKPPPPVLSSSFNVSGHAFEAGREPHRMGNVIGRNH